MRPRCDGGRGSSLPAALPPLCRTAAGGCTRRGCRTAGAGIRPDEHRSRERRRRHCGREVGQGEMVSGPCLHERVDEAALGAIVAHALPREVPAEDRGRRRLCGGRRPFDAGLEALAGVHSQCDGLSLVRAGHEHELPRRSQPRPRRVEGPKVRPYPRGSRDVDVHVRARGGSRARTRGERFAQVEGAPGGGGTLAIAGLSSMLGRGRRVLNVGCGTGEHNAGGAALAKVESGSAR
mmetsp:Transcript_52722/g.162300  ORF Transcript_52722/g.162300 Transcript_52722/m.162300 type:complete len:236 (-) Transcript_52722:222-929(-)